MHWISHANFYCLPSHALASACLNLHQFIQIEVCTGQSVEGRQANFHCLPPPRIGQCILLFDKTSLYKSYFSLKYCWLQFINNVNFFSHSLKYSKCNPHSSKLGSNKDLHLWLLVHIKSKFFRIWVEFNDPSSPDSLHYISTQALYSMQ